MTILTEFSNAAEPMESLPSEPVKNEAEMLASIRGMIHMLANMAHRRHGGDEEEILSEANYAAIKAIRLFEPERGFKITTFAWAWITGRLKRFCEKQRREYNQEDLGHVADTESLNEDDGELVRDTTLMLVAIEKIKKPRLKQVLRMRMEGLTLSECGKNIGLSRERVRQLELQAKDRIFRIVSRLKNPKRRADSKPSPGFLRDPPKPAGYYQSKSSSSSKTAKAYRRLLRLGRCPRCCRQKTERYFLCAACHERKRRSEKRRQLRKNEGKPRRAVSRITSTKCGHMSYKRHGKDRNGTQRYRCRICGTTFLEPVRDLVDANPENRGETASSLE